jgi:hypothetical protein
MKYMLGIYFSLLAAIFFLLGVIHRIEHANLTETQLLLDAGMWWRLGPAIGSAITAAVLFGLDDDDPDFV